MSTPPAPPRALTLIDSWKMSISTIRTQIELVLPKHLTVDRFVQQVMFAMAKNPDLQKCDKPSVFNSCMALAELGLDPSGALGSGYLVPFKGVCTPIPGYRGLIDLAVRSGEVKAMKANVVFWGDEFDIDEGDRPRLHHKPKIPQSQADEKAFENHQSAGNVRGAYAVATLPGGYKQFHWMTWRELEGVRLRAPGGKSERTPWATDRVQMYKKCPIRQIVKHLPLSPVKASLLMRAEQIEEANERLVSDMGDEDVTDKKQAKGAAERFRQSLRNEEPEEADIQQPPDDVVLPTKADEPKKE